MIRRFNRFELKYIITVKKAEEIIEDIKNLTVPDLYGAQNGYRVVSLYYDSPQLDFFWDKIEGIKFRRKLRIRIYPLNNIEDTTEGMVEIKQRLNRTVQKRRLCLPLAKAEQLCAGVLKEERMGTGILDEIIDPLDQQVASEIQYIVRAKHLKPTCITDYHRKAFLGNIYDYGLRITFDTDVKARVHGLKINLNTSNHVFLSPDRCIMEVKVNEAVPDWMTSLLARHECQIKRDSKYCTGLATARGIRVLPFTISPVLKEVC